MIWLYGTAGAAAALVAGLLYLIGGAVRRHPLAELFARYDYAHRGLHDNDAAVPENSLLAFGRAVEKGYGIELDVQLTRDGQVVVFHDFLLERMTGERARVGDYLGAQVKALSLLNTPERVPLLSDLLALVDGRVPLLIEIKTPHAGTQICPALWQALKGYNGPYAIQSFNPLAVRWFKKKDRRVMRGQLSRGMHKDGTQKGLVGFMAENLLTNFLSRPHYIAYRHEDMHKRGFRFCKRWLRMKTAAWTVKSEADYTRLASECDYIIFEGFTPK